MRITLLALGSRGDIQPFLILAYGLAKAGHKATLVTNTIYSSLVKSYGLDFRTVAWDPRQSMQIQSVMAEGNWRVKLTKAGEFQRLLQRTYEEVE